MELACDLSRLYFGCCVSLFFVEQPSSSTTSATFHFRLYPLQSNCTFFKPCSNLFPYCCRRTIVDQGLYSSISIVLGMEFGFVHFNQIRTHTICHVMVWTLIFSTCSPSCFTVKFPWKKIWRKRIFTSSSCRFGPLELIKWMPVYFTWLA